MKDSSLKGEKFVTDSGCTGQGNRIIFIDAIEIACIAGMA